MATPDHADLTAIASTLLTDDHRMLFRDLLQGALQQLIEDELTASIGAALHERTETRTTHRNGHRPRTLSTPAGDIELAIPKTRTGSFFPSLLEPRRRVDQALWAVIMTAYVTGTSTRKVDDLVRALGVDSGVSKSTVSRICGEIDEHVEAFRTRTLAHTTFPYVFCDATYVKGRVAGRVVSRAVVVAFGVAADGTREVLGVDLGDSEDEAFWGQFLRGLKTRGLTGVQLVISDAHEGLKRAVARHLQGAAWQRCRVHFNRNVLARVGKTHGEMVTATIRTIFVQADADAVHAHLGAVADTLRGRFPDVADALLDAEADLTAFAAFPKTHWRRIWSTNPLERVNKEIKRRSNVVGIFPDDASILRLVGAVLLEQHDEWQVAERRYFSDESMKTITTNDVIEVTPATTAA
ncbi:IS256 family transposase [Euzebya sp.]|uniref:IS256 family transposase n=1 Tax=Euzebya sp. TaxID=1971409 RepID=UPI003510F605